MKAEWLEQDGARLWRRGGGEYMEYEAIIRVTITYSELVVLPRLSRLDEVIPALKAEIAQTVSTLIAKG